MALFSRSLKPNGDNGSPDADGEADMAGARHTIGELLRETRQSYGGDIDRIAGLLRIRVSYLNAIEQSQYDKLPGPVYAQGFVRAYAVHLGLDGDEAVRRFKQEVAGFGVTRDLSFPVPLAERSIPGGTMVLAALILAICGYGLWYYVSTSDRSHPERVSAVPPDLVAAAQKPAVPDNPTPSVSPTAPDTSVAASGSTAATSSAAPSGASTASSAGASSPAAPTAPAAPAGSAVTGTAAAPSAPAPRPAPTPAPTAASAPSVVAPATSAAPAPSPATPAPPSASAAAQPVAAPVATDVASGAAATGSNPALTAPAAPQVRVYGAPADVPARIIVHAIKDSWVQLRNGDEVLVQRILHPGDSVRIPDESGLSLRTGNGAGLQLEVDGKLGKPLSGTVRTVDLDAYRAPGASGATAARGE